MTYPTPTGQAQVVSEYTNTNAAVTTYPTLTGAPQTNSLYTNTQVTPGAAAVAGTTSTGAAKSPATTTLAAAPAATTSHAAANALLTVGVEIIAAGVFAVIADSSDDMAGLVWVFTIGLWIMFLVQHAANIKGISNVITYVSGGM